MAQAETAPASALTAAPPGGLLVKADRPRAIDRFIDYFGTAGPDVCGERLLDETDAAEPREEGVA